MAEIKVERSAGGSIWPWVIGALVVLALVWFFFIRNDDNTTANDTVGLRAVPVAVASPSTA